MAVDDKIDMAGKLIPTKMIRIRNEDGSPILDSKGKSTETIVFLIEDGVVKIDNRKVSEKSEMKQKFNIPE